jgi:hypothetical protein
MLNNFRGSDRALLVRSLTAAGSGVAAKVLGLINQIVSVTLISGALGAEGLQQQMLAIASVSWFSLTLFGMHTSLPALLIRSGVNKEGFASIAKTAYLLAVLGAMAAVGLTALILNLDLIGGIAAAPIATATACSGAAVILSLSEKIFLATDRIAEFNILNLAGTLISLAATAVLARSHGTPADFVISFYVGILLPLLVATFVVIPKLNLTSSLSRYEFRTNARELIGVGAFGFGYEVSAYCKLQAPLALLGVLDLSNEIAPVGLGLRLVTLIGGGLSIIIPILFLRIGAAIQIHDQNTRRQWTRLGIACAAAFSVVGAGSFLIFGQAIYRTWTGGAVTLSQTEQAAIAAFAALSLAQFLLFPLAAPDPAIARQLRWMFWLEGPAALTAGAVGALVVPLVYAGAGMLAGVTLVMGVVILILLVLLTSGQSSRRSERLDETPRVAARLEGP